MKGGAKHTKQQFYQNVINQPLLHGPRDRKVLGLLNIPELHLLIGKINPYKNFKSNLFVSGIVDKLILGFESSVFETPEMGREWMDRYLKEVN